jgi:hypothetical protein
MSMKIKGTGGTFNIKNNGPGGSFKSKIVVPPVLDIETSGLVLHLDAGNASSYPGSGATWYDISGNGKDATLFNSPTYSSSNGGTLTFAAASTQYAQGPTVGSLSSFTATCWVKFNSLPGSGTYNCIMTDIFGSPQGINWMILFQQASNHFRGGFYETYNDGFHLAPEFTSITPSTGVWYNYTATYDGSSSVKLYVDGSLSATNTLAGPRTASSAGNGYRIAAEFDVAANGLVDGIIPKVAVYNRALSDSEVLSNYNAIAPRYA